ncbi:MAG: general secretion pathway protein GspB [Rubrivivax sp.]|nr:general secretion pathway protein GspB [Rubrivivax sp.]
MSFILDALRRADAERQRGQTPALQQVTRGLPTAADPARRARRTVLLAIAVIGLALVSALLGGWLSRTPAPAARAAPAATPSSAPAASAPAVAPPAPVAAPASAPPPAGTPAPAPKLVAAPIPAPALPPRPASAAPSKPVTLGDLPEPLRQAVLRLVFSGGVYSPDPAQRFVMLGGLLVREGSDLGDGIRLERITPRSALLRVDGRLIERPY